MNARDLPPHIVTSGTMDDAPDPDRFCAVLIAERLYRAWTLKEAK